MKHLFYLIGAVMALFSFFPTNSQAQTVKDGKLNGCQFMSDDKYVIPDEVEVVDTMCFFGASCSEIVVSKNVKRIAPMAFYMCMNLQKIVFEEGSAVEIIGGSAFGECTSLQEITLPNTVRVLGENAFTFDEALKSITLSESLERLESGSIGTCINLKKLEIPASVKVIEDFAIANNSNLKRVIIHGADSIGARAFYHNVALFDVQLPETLKAIGDSCFMRCEMLEELELPASLEKAGDKMFFMCPDFNGYTVAEGSKNFTAIDGVLYSKDKSVLYECPQTYSADMFEVPAEVKVIRPAAFMECKDVKGIRIPSTIEGIGVAALANNGMAEFDFEGNDKYLKDGSSIYTVLSENKGLAFLAHPSKCEDKEIVVLPRTLILADYAMAYNESVETVYLPEELVGLSHGAMSGDKNIRDIYSYAEKAPQLEDDSVFGGLVLTQVELHVFGDMSVYQSYTDAGWMIAFGSDITEEYPGKEVTGIDGIENTSDNAVAGYYNVDGTIKSCLSKGLNIIKYADGTSTKVIVR